MARPRISTTVSRQVMNQLAWLCSTHARPQNNMLEYLITQEFKRATDLLPEPERTDLVEQVISTHTYVSTF